MGSALSLVLLAYFLVFPYSSNAEESCPSDTVGLCTPGVTEVIESDTVTSTETSSTGTTTTEVITETTTTTTVTNENIGDLLTDQKVSAMGRNQKFGGDMSSDWGGQGPATIKVEKRDASDRIYMHITGKDGSTVSFAGTDILSEAGVASGYQAYSGGFDFGGTLTSLIVEVGGRDINLSIGPLFDDVTVNVLWNVISTIVLEQITTIESFVSLGIFDQETIDVATNVFENNNISIGPGGQTDIQPNIEENVENMPSYETVQMEMEIEMPDVEFGSSMNMDMPTSGMSIPEVEVEMSVNIEMEMENDTSSETMGTTPSQDSKDISTPEPESTSESAVESSTEQEPESNAESNAESSAEQEPAAKPQDAASSDSKPEPKQEVAESKTKKGAVQTQPAKKQKVKSVSVKKQEKKQVAKQKAAKKILKKMGDKRKYDNVNQIKTLIVMQVLGNTKDFFSAQKLIPQPEGFFTQTRIPDATLSDNNYNQYFLFGGSDAAHNALTESQYRR